MISATELAHWAGTTPAQSELPRLVRRLVHAAASLTQISFPAGDSVTSPGFDGELHSHEGNAWVPAGFSVWELSCRGDVGTKANEDFDKRCAATPESVRATRTYVAVTARRWPGKAKWREAKAALNIWSDVRAYDADDIEQWLEQSPAVALAFGGELGLSGSGVEAVAGYFGRWAGQCRPVISSEALLAGRTEQAAAHLERIRAIIGGQVRDPLAVKADSVEEAVAFVAAALLGDAELEASAVVVTGAEGWRFVEANPNVRIAVAGSPAIAEAPVLRDGLAVVVPYASGDMARLFAGVASKLDDNELSLERAIHYEFEKALALIGVEGNDARRLATLCGRSWSVFRRQHAVNPAIRRPAWLDHPASAALALLCLAGAWSSAHDADVEILERIAGRSYCEIEAELLALERLDDSPVLQIGKVWKAKSALELLALFGDRIDVALLDRYFAEVEAVLAAPDPQLELPDSERYAASIKGKVRPISGMLLEALCDTLVKLAVRGPEVPALAVRDIAGRIDRLVRHLLFGADRTRWLSLASQLPALAEASPHEFLSAVEDGIAAPDGAARAVFHETSGTGFGSRCWHSGMLWALETLAWAPNRLRRVALILARLSDIQIAGNWSNSPRASLQDIFRPWFPQTGATIDQRIRTLDHLMEHAPELTFALFDHMTDTGLDHASYIARPKWRDDDAGAGHGATRNERQEMMVAAIERQIAMAKGYPDRVRELVGKYMTLDTARRGEIMTLLGECETAGDGDREAVRSALRRKLFWHRNYEEKRPPAELDALLAPLEEAYDRLEPDDLIVRHGWLFNAGFADLPERRPRDDFEGRRKAAAEAAQAALREIFDAHGWEGVMRLAEQEGNPGVVGAALARIGMPVDDLDHWIVGHAGDLWADQPRTRITTSLLLAEPADTQLSRIDRLLAAAADSGRDADWQARLLMLLPHDPAIWDRAEKIGRTDYYWRTCDANLWIDTLGDKLAALRQLIAHERPVSALNTCYSQFENIPAALVMEMLEGILKGQEINDGVMPHSYAFQYAVDHIEADGSVDETRLAQIEFALIPCLGYTNEHHARTLYKVVMSQPGTFVELLCLIYKPRHGEQPELDESAKTNAETAWRVLRACEHVPGTQKDGSIDADELRAFVTEARRMAIEQDRAGACDTTLGQILAHAPEGQDAIWPAEAVRDIFEAEASEKMFEGLWVGCMNKRGVHSRGAYEGGDQERDLAADYRRHGNALEASHPQLAASVLSIADYYDRHGLFEDMDARLRQEGH